MLVQVMKGIKCNRHSRRKGKEETSSARSERLKKEEGDRERKVRDGMEDERMATAGAK